MGLALGASLALGLILRGLVTLDLYHTGRVTESRYHQSTKAINCMLCMHMYTDNIICILLYIYAHVPENPRTKDPQIRPRTHLPGQRRAAITSHPTCPRPPSLPKKALSLPYVTSRSPAYIIPTPNPRPRYFLQPVIPHKKRLWHPNRISFLKKKNHPCPLLFPNPRPNPLSLVSTFFYFSSLLCLPLPELNWRFVRTYVHVRIRILILVRRPLPHTPPR